MHILPTIVKRLSLGIIAALTLATSVTSVAQAACPSGMSNLDCQAITEGWQDWVPNVCTNTAAAGGGGSVTFVGNDNQQKLFNYFVSNGFTPAQAAGIVGNAIVESIGVDPEMSQLDRKDHQNPPQPDNPQLGWGIVQWTPARKILNYAQATSQPAYLLSTQAAFLLNQLNGTAPNDNEKHAGDMLKQVTTGIVANGVQESTAWHAAQVFLVYFERAADSSPDGPNAHLRGRFADEVLAKYGGASPVGGSGNPTGTPTTSAAPGCTSGATGAGTSSAGVGCTGASGKGKFTDTNKTVYPGVQTVCARAKEISSPSSTLFRQWCAVRGYTAPPCEVGFCAFTAAFIWGHTAAGYGSATIEWGAMVAQGHGHPGDRNPPIGALLFYHNATDPNNFGHVDVYLGGNTAVSSDWPSPGYVDVIPAGNIETVWHETYLGWSDPVYVTPKL